MSDDSPSSPRHLAQSRRHPQTPIGFVPSWCGRMGRWPSGLARTAHGPIGFVPSRRDPGYLGRIASCADCPETLNPHRLRSVMAPHAGLGRPSSHGEGGPPGKRRSQTGSSRDDDPPSQDEPNATTMAGVAFNFRHFGHRKPSLGLIPVYDPGRPKSPAHGTVKDCGARRENQPARSGGRR
jgi:hypothetical protein